MSNGYFLADANTLAYAYRAGGPELLDLYSDIAEEEGRKLAITKIVESEIEKGPLGKDILQYFADRDITVLSAPDTEQRLRNGLIPSKSSGEVSMLEIAAQEHAQGRTTRIWADDKYFDSTQIMGRNPGAKRTMSAALLDEAYEQQFIDAADYTRFREGYQTQGAFIDSARLNSFRYSDLSPDTTIDAPTRAIPAPETPASPATETPHTALPEDAVPRISKPPYGEGGFIHPELLIGDLSPRQALRMGGGALTGIDAYQTTVQASELWKQDNATAANEQWARFGARIISGLDKTDLHYSSEKGLMPKRKSYAVTSHFIGERQC